VGNVIPAGIMQFSGNYAHNYSSFFSWRGSLEALSRAVTDFAAFFARKICHFSHSDPEQRCRRPCWSANREHHFKI